MLINDPLEGRITEKQAKEMKRLYELMVKAERRYYAYRREINPIPNMIMFNKHAN